MLHVDTSRLPIGVFPATLTVRSKGSQAPPTIVPVSVLMEPPTIVANPGALLLEGPASGGALTADPTGLGEGDYGGSFTISLPSSGTRVTVPVTLRVNDGQGRLLVNPQALAFSVTPLPDGSALSGKRLTISDTRGGTFTVSAGGGPLLLSQYTGNIPATVTAQTDPQTAVMGDKELNGQITISRRDENKTDTVTIPFSIAAAVSRPSVASVVSTASYAAGPLAPGSLITIFGQDLALVPVIPDLSGKAPDIMTPPGLYYPQTTVKVNSASIPLLYASPTQVNAIIPMFVQGQMTLTVNGVGSTALPITFASAAPALFLSAEGVGLAFNGDGTPNSLTTPATAGEIVRVFAAGLGRVDGNFDAGAPAHISPLLHPSNKVSATIGQANAEVVECALQPGEIGVYFVDVRIPSLPGGQHAVVVTAAGKSSNSVLIAVKPAGS